MRNAKRLMMGTLAGLAMVVGTSAHATILTFDTDQTGYSGTSTATMPAGYGGFNWTDMGIIHESHHPVSGYNNGTVSGSYTAYNRFGDPAGMSVANPNVFDFTGAYMTAAWTTGLTVSVSGYLDGNFVDSDSIIVDTTGPTWWQVDFIGIDELVFSTSDNSQFAMDNFTYNESNAPVPEPATMTLLGLGLAGLAVRTRKARK